jgi:hypothetical protein
MPGSVQTHRFRDEVAICASGTLYLSPADALRLASAIRKAAMSCRKEPFSVSSGLTLAVPGRRSGEPRKGE